MDAQPIIEVSNEFDPEFAEAGLCYVYRDGVRGKGFKTFEAAMRAAYPGWQPHRDYAASFGEYEGA